MRVGFAGLGVMGGPMAGHLASKGHDTLVYNRTAGKEKHAVAQGANVAAAPAELAEQCQIVFLCVSRSEDVRELLDKMLPHAAEGTLFVDHSTISPKVAGQLHEEMRRDGFRFLDAPITGGSMGAEKGTLTIFCGGTEDAYQSALPFMRAYGKTVAHVGAGGQGQMMKMANQIAVAGSLVGLCEALSFAEKAGLNLEQTKEIVGSGAAGSWAFDNYGPKILNQDWSPGFTVQNQLKDFAYCREAAQEVG
ncbi:MAG: NAD(P)-dependent oxidoreductase, partial [Fimbriimonadaceae bacterium]